MPNLWPVPPTTEGGALVPGRLSLPLVGGWVGWDWVGGRGHRDLYERLILIYSAPEHVKSTRLAHVVAYFVALNG